MTTPSTDDPAQQPKSLGERILGSVPIVLTVVATLLAGLSSSEMTQAQYYRSLAAQYQSKVGDQWGFFQAKRMRGFLSTVMADQLEVLAVSAPDLGRGFRYLDELHLHLDRVLAQSENLNRALLSMSQLEALSPVAKKLSELQDAVGKVKQDRASDEFTEKLQSWITEWGSNRLWNERLESLTIDVKSKLEALSPDLKSAMEVSTSHLSDQQLPAQLERLAFHQLQTAVHTVQSLATAFEGEAQERLRRYGHIDDQIERRVRWLRRCFTRAKELTAAWEAVPLSARKGLAESELAYLQVTRSVDRLAEFAAELVRECKIARDRYNKHRYDVEGMYNKNIAELYELHVAKYSHQSEKHRHRSHLFFYAMLVAQAGVTMGTFALTVRQLSALWAAASLAGVMSMAAGVYVYFFI